MSDDPRHQESLSMPGRCRSCMETWPCQVERLRTDLAAQSLALATMREALRDLCNVVEDARSVGEMQGENFAMSPWSDLERAAPRYLPLLAEPADTAAALAGAVLGRAEMVVARASGVLSVLGDMNDDELKLTDALWSAEDLLEGAIVAYREARAALRGGEGPGREGEWA